MPTFRILIAETAQTKFPPWWEAYWLHPQPGTVEAPDPLEALALAIKRYPHFRGRLAVEPLYDPT